MELHGKNLVAGSLAAEGSLTFRAVDPATGVELEPPFHEARADEINRAVESAELAFAERDRDPDPIVKLLETVAEEIELLGDTLIDRAVAETGLGQPRLKSERGRTTAQLRLFADVVREGSWVDARIDRGRADRRPIPKPDVRRMLIPLGPVAVFGASNFPLAFSVAGGDTASALAAGNPVIVKAHPAHPGTSELVAGAIQRALAAAEMPDDWFSMVHGLSTEVGTVLVRHPAVRAVGFTGSLAGGKALFDAAAERDEPIPFFAEMGSTNPVFLLPHALARRADEIARAMHASVTLGVGQFCTKPGLIVGLAGPELDRFIALLADHFRQSGPGTMLHRGILERFEQNIEELSIRPNVRLVAHGSRDPDRARTEGPATLFAVDAESFLADPRMGDEIFGPSTLVVECRSADEMLDIACNLPGQLTATLHATADDLDLFAQLPGVLELKVGRLLWGGFPTGVEVCPAMHHGGPFPATTDVRSTSVGTAAITRFARPICYQDWPPDRLPPELQDRNARGIWRLVNNRRTTDDVE